jgi:threonine dehydrogenase-like Zn-dependent dehydrogenase
MRALYHDGAGGLGWRDDPEPAIEAPTDALVRPVAASTCDVDQAILRGSIPGIESPYPIGHEAVGEVWAVGDSVSGVGLGDLVVVPYHVSCGACDRCARGLPLFCRSTSLAGTPSFGMPFRTEYGGMFSELIRVPFADYSLVRLPQNVTPLQAVSVGDNLTDAWRVIAPHLLERPGADVLIMSTCTTGLLAADIARACGAGRIRYVDRDPARLQRAEQLGVETETLSEFRPEAGEYEITVNATDSRTALRNAVLATAPGGHCESMAFHFSDVPMPLLAMHLKCLHFRTSLCNARPHIPAVLGLLASGSIDPEFIRTDLLPFELADQMLSAGEKPVYTRPTSREESEAG